MSALKLIPLLEHGSIEEIKKILDIDNNAINEIDEDANTPLILACRFGRLDIVKELVAHGADVNKNIPHIRDHHAKTQKTSEWPGSDWPGFIKSKPLEYNYWTPLLAATTHNHPKIVAFLLDHKADWRPQDHFGFNALHYAAWGRPEIVKLLLDYGADVNLPTKHNETPLLLACMIDNTLPYDPKYTEIVKILLSHGANPDIGSASMFPFEQSFRPESTNVPKYEIVQELIKAGVFIHEGFINDFIEEGHLDLIKTIIESDKYSPEFKQKIKEYAEHYYQATDDQEYKENVYPQIRGLFAKR